MDETKKSMGMFDIFKRKPTPQERAQRTDADIVNGIFKETGAKFEGRPHGFDALAPTDAQVAEAEAKAEARRAREAEDRAKAAAALQEAKGANAGTWVEATSHPSGEWTNEVEELKKAE